jgi:hypothetical protein
MKDHKGSEIDFDHVFAILELENWDDFPIFVKKNHNLKGYIFRGHRCSSFELVPTLLRELRSKGRGFTAKALSQQLTRFHLAVRKYAAFEIEGNASPLFSYASSNLKGGVPAR